VAYDFGTAVEGPLYLMLGHGEHEVGGIQNETRYIQDEFVVAARPNLPKRPAVELARIHLSSRGTVIKNAADSRHPAIDELDLRYRQCTGPQPIRLTRVGLLTAGKSAAQCLSGWDHLARECQRGTDYRLVVDVDVPISAEMGNYDLLYLAASGAFHLDATFVKELIAYLSQGKALMVEALEAAAEESCKTLLANLGVNLKPVVESDAVLAEPHAFSAPPPGGQNGQVWLGKGIVYSSAAYNLAWNGRINGVPGARADIRSALEWGVNLVAYCLG
jgi:hypothetical protein